VAKRPPGFGFDGPRGHLPKRLFRRIIACEDCGAVTPGRIGDAAIAPACGFPLFFTGFRRRVPFLPVPPLEENKS
jgi:hypothetical protein